MQDEEAAKQWAADINEAVSDISCRPRTLLVIVNPWGGCGRARRVWTREAYPVLSQAGDLPDARMTKASGQAIVMLAFWAALSQPEGHGQECWCCAEPGRWPVKPCMLCMCPSSYRFSHITSAISQRRLCLESDIKQGHEAVAGAGVRCVVVETRHPLHAKDIVAALPMHELELYDGILAVIFTHRTTSFACPDALQCSEPQLICHICGAIMHTRVCHETISASEWGHGSDCML